MSGRIEGPAEIPRLTACFLRLPFVLLHGPLVDHVGKKQDLATKCRFTRVNVPNKNDVDMGFDCEISVSRMDLTDISLL